MTIYIVDIESVETRYTGEWKTYIPELIKQNVDIDQSIVVVNGVEDIPPATTPGAFLNFGGTNVYKASQVEKISRMVCAGKVRNGDHFLFTDAWHPGIINLKYMAELLGIKITTHGLWHAGSYDPADFLGRLIGDESWIRNAEKSFFYAFDHNYFATKYHIKMFETNLLENAEVATSSIIRTGWPMDYMPGLLENYLGSPKSNLILFPHRIAPEKQVDIFYDLAKEMPEYKWVVCQETPLSKDQYHRLLAESKMVFSAALQETLGIVGYEGAILGSMPMVPDRLSYSEMYQDRFKYPSEWTTDWESYQKHKDKLIKLIKYMMENFNDFTSAVSNQANYLQKHFFTANELLNKLV